MQLDAIVIGGSFAGLSSATQIARACRSVCVVDAGLPRNRFASALHGFFGRDGATPAEMIRRARDHLCTYPSVTVIDGVALGAQADPDGGFRVRLESGAQLSARKLVLAFGVSDVLPDMPGLAERWGASVLYCPYCHGYEFRAERLGVLDVGPISPYQASLLADRGPVTFFLNGRNDLDDAARSQLAKRGVAIEAAPIAGLEGDAPGLTGIALADGRSVPTSALYLLTETRMNSPIAEQLGCAFDDGPLGPVIRIDATGMSTVPGVYAAGDIVHAAHNNATLASSDGVTTGVSLHQALVFDATQS
jgi:thioredoxin reductase